MTSLPKELETDFINKVTVGPAYAINIAELVKWVKQNEIVIDFKFSTKDSIYFIFRRDDLKGVVVYLYPKSMSNVSKSFYSYKRYLGKKNSYMSDNTIYRNVKTERTFFPHKNGLDEELYSQIEN